MTRLSFLATLRGGELGGVIEGWGGRWQERDKWSEVAHLTSQIVPDTSMSIDT